MNVFIVTKEKYERGDDGPTTEIVGVYLDERRARQTARNRSGDVAEYAVNESPLPKAFDETFLWHVYDHPTSERVLLGVFNDEKVARVWMDANGGHLKRVQVFVPAHDPTEGH